MSQEYNTSVKKARRTRAPRNRPVLVTTVGDEQAEELQTRRTDDLLIDTESLGESINTTPAPTPVAPRPSRLPNFFSRVAKTEQEETTTTADDVVKARLARATHNKTGKATAVAENDQTTKVAKPVSKTPERPRMFKPRHFLGMMIYLLGAEFLLPVEGNYLKSAHMDATLVPSLFGQPSLSLTTGFLVNIATLIILLYALVKLDFLPNSLTGGSAARQRAAQQSKNAQSTSEPGVRQIPPAIKQGVKGQHDNLYQEYRTSMRREKKR